MPGTRPGMTSGEGGFGQLRSCRSASYVASMCPSWPAEAMKRCFAQTFQPPSVMAGRGDEALLRADVPAIHVLSCWSKDVDARHKAGHDEW